MTNNFIILNQWRVSLRSSIRCGICPQANPSCSCPVLVSSRPAGLSCLPTACLPLFLCVDAPFAEPTDPEVNSSILEPGLSLSDFCIPLLASSDPLPRSAISFVATVSLSLCGWGL